MSKIQVLLSSGDYNIVANGESFLFGPSEDLTLQIIDGNELLLKVIMKFKDDDSGERDINTVIMDDSLVINCINFSGLGTGLKNPTHIASINKKKVYLMFSSSSLGNKENKSRSVKYTVYMER